ncbi:hypothetical protein [Streptomyces sirii]|uniref:hypothetical protein n=1 Tax=Streptomyces sirii TaxID=3127701 RepID=UPI003D3614FD
MSGPEGPNGHIVGVADNHLIAGWYGKDRMSSSVHDAATGKGYCADAGEDAKKISLTAVGDDGSAYGTAKEGEGNNDPWIPVSVSARTGAKPLPTKTEIPHAMTKDTGVFFTFAGGNGLRMVVLRLKS